MDRSSAKYQAGTNAMDAHSHKLALDCKGFLDDDEGLRLHDLAREHAQLGPILEIGSYCGKSSVYIGGRHGDVGGLLVCVDHHRGSEENQPGEEYHDAELLDRRRDSSTRRLRVRRTLHDAGLEDNAVLMVARSPQRRWRAPLGMVFIDGGHTFEAAHGDYDAWAGHVAPGGILAIHDLFPDPTKADRHRSRSIAARSRRGTSTSCRRRRRSAFCVGAESRATG